MKIKITKALMIQAIKEEPFLGAGNWLNTDPFVPTLERAASCRVCAVGSVLRRVLHPNQRPMMLHNAARASLLFHKSLPDTFAYFREEAMDLVNQAAWTSALSVFFEGITHAVFEGGDQFRLLMNDEDGQVIRNECRLFVEENFPDEMVIDIDGALPAPGVEVVE